MSPGPSPEELAATDPLWVYRKPVVRIATPAFTFLIDSSRFGRRFTPASELCRVARITKGHGLNEVAHTLGLDKAVLSHFEDPAPATRLRVSAQNVVRLAVLLEIEPLELQLAYAAHTYPLLRATAYPDDPGPAGEAFSLPLAGARERLAARDKAFLTKR